MTYTSFKPKALSCEESRVVELDGLRGVAILFVIVWHYFGLVFNPQPKTFLGYVHALARMTWSGVDLFFVLSGYLISTNLMAAREHSGYFRVFYARRFARILPLYLTLLVVHSILTLPTVNRVLGPISYLFNDQLHKWSYFTFTQNILMATEQRFSGPILIITWSLAVE